MWEQLLVPTPRGSPWPPAPDTVSFSLSPAWLASYWGKGTGIEVTLARFKFSFFFCPARVPLGTLSLRFFVRKTGILQERVDVRIET